ncbi:MAG: prepilin-type N-terminal cleavage/methylation domain-containing protein [Deltaproteobacteria bacterium]|nr:prepilin-type N-terminal cleavage/methylation domain-containing protein [Deltaproteobacteria bacterium]
MSKIPRSLLRGASTRKESIVAKGRDNLPKISDREKGFTLVELLIAITVLSIGLLGVASMFSTGIRSNSFSYMVTVESSVANSVMEEILAKDGGDVIFAAAAANAVYDLDTGSAVTTRTVQGRTYSATYSITVNNPVVNVSMIDVSVTSGGRTTTLTSYKNRI